MFGPAFFPAFSALLPLPTPCHVSDKTRRCRLSDLKTFRSRNSTTHRRRVGLKRPGNIGRRVKRHNDRTAQYGWCAATGRLRASVSLFVLEQMPWVPRATAFVDRTAKRERRRTASEVRGVYPPKSSGRATPAFFPPITPLSCFPPPSYSPTIPHPYPTFPFFLHPFPSSPLMSLGMT